MGQRLWWETRAWCDRERLWWETRAWCDRERLWWETRAWCDRGSNLHAVRERRPVPHVANLPRVRVRRHRLSRAQVALAVHVDDGLPHARRLLPPQQHVEQRSVVRVAVHHRVVLLEPQLEVPLCLLGRAVRQPVEFALHRAHRSLMLHHKRRLALLLQAAQHRGRHRAEAIQPERPEPELVHALGPPTQLESPAGEALERPVLRRLDLF